MADENPVAEASAPRRSKGRLVQVAVVAALMLGEGAAIFLVTRALQPTPAPALAAGGPTPPAQTTASWAKWQEVELAECKPSNSQLGKLVTYQIRVSALVAAEQVEHVRELVKVKEARIHDRVNYVIRSADPRHLEEPGLETIKRRLRHELDDVFAEKELLKDILVPELLQSRPGV